jgi:hypothetical protein
LKRASNNVFIGFLGDMAIGTLSLIYEHKEKGRKNALFLMSKELSSDLRADNTSD